MKQIMSIFICATMMLSIIYTTPITTQAKALKSGDYQYEILDNGSVKLQKYLGDEETVVIPKKLDGMAVTVLGKGCFSSNKSLLSVTVGNHITAMEEEVFFKANYLQSATLNCKITILPERTFSGCQALENLTLPVTLHTIGNSCFKNCFSLTKAPLFEGIQTVGDEAFMDCSGLTEIIIPKSLKALPNSIFKGCRNIRTVSLPAGLEHIGISAFEKCTTLANITLPDTLKTINDRAFFNCKALETINIPSSVILIGAEILKNTAFFSHEDNWENGQFLYHDNVLFGIQNATEIDLKIKEGTRLMAGSLFGENTNTIKTLIIPDSVISIGNDAFSNNNSLQYIAGGNNVEYCGERYYLPGPINKELFETPNNTYYIGKCLIACSSIKDTLKVKKGTCSIADSVFDYCNYAKEFSFPASLKEPLKPSNVQYLYNLQRILVDENNPIMSSKNGVLFNKNKSKIIYYPIEKKGANYTLPATVKTIGESAFQNNNYLKSISIGKKVKNIEDKAFLCTKITTFDIPENVQNIGKNVFFYEYSYNLNKKKTYTLKGYKGSAAEAYSKNTPIFKEKNVRFISNYYVDMPKATIKKQGKTITVKSGKVKKATGYEIQYKKGKTVKYKTILTKKSLNTKIKKLKKGSYEVKVRAFSKQGNYKLYSKWSKTKKITIK